MKSKKLIALGFGILAAVSWLPEGFTLEKPTHEYVSQQIAQRTVNGFSLDAYLKNSLGFQGGAGEPILAYSETKKRTMKRAIFEWLGEGGIKEDEPEGYSKYLSNTARNNNHFHNPLVETWDKAGLDIDVSALRSLFPLLFRLPYPFPDHIKGQSSILWAHNKNQDSGGKWSWYDARDYFYKGLTLTDKTQRDTAMANTFRALGQLMHLIQDASVPAHVRGEFHFLPFHYESWLEALRNGSSQEDRQRFNNFIAIPSFFDRSILDGSPNPLPSISGFELTPIARIIDTDQYNGSNPEVTFTRPVGIAEFTNANFFGEFVSLPFAPKCPSPDLKSSNVEEKKYDLRDPSDPNKTVARKYYYRKIDEAGNGYRLATVGFLKDYITKYFPSYMELLRRAPALDEGVYNDYAEKLLPRAVGYSAGLLEYFFSGRLQVTSLPIFYKNGIYIMRGKIKNITPTQETMKNGWFTLSYHYTPTGKPTDGSEDIYGQTSVCSSESPCEELKYQDEKSFDFILPELIPKGLYDSVKFTLAFKGTLGNEEGAVIGKYFTPGEIKFNEEWDNGLTGNHTWAHLDFGTSQTYPGHGQTSNTIGGDTLIKENIRYAGFMNPSANGSFVGIDSYYPGYQDNLPILITPNTSLQFKIDKMSINQIPPSPPGMTAHHQGLWLFFNHGLVLQLSQNDQFVYYNPTTAMRTFELGLISVENIYKMFQDAGIAIPPGDLYLEKIDFIQQLFELAGASTVGHRQHMEVDFIRIIEEKQEEEKQ